MCARWPALAVALAAAFPTLSARADDDAPEKPAVRALPPTRVDMTLTTLALTAPVLLEGEQLQIAPVYEQVRLSASNLKAPGLDDLAVHVSGWTALNAGQLAGGQRLSGDFAYAYVDAAALDRRVRLRLGRQLVTGGAARMLSVDGWQVVAAPTRTYGATAFGGIRVLPGFTALRSDAVYGARGYWRPKYGTEVGLSWLRQYDAGRLGRHDAGLDARWQPIVEGAVQGSVIWGLAESRLVEGILGADYRFTPELQLWAGLRRTRPDLFLSRASIFSVFSQENTDEASAELSWSPSRRLRARGDFAALSTAAGSGQRFGARVTGNPLAGESFLVGAETRRLSLPGRGYWQARLFCSDRLGEKGFVTADLDAYFLDVAMNGQTQALTAVVTGGMDLATGLRLMLAALAGSTPLYAERYEVTARLAWDLTYSGEVAP